MPVPWSPFDSPRGFISEKWKKSTEWVVVFYADQDEPRGCGNFVVESEDDKEDSVEDDEVIFCFFSLFTSVPSYEMTLRMSTITQGFIFNQFLSG